MLVGACIAGPPTVRGQILGSAGRANAGRASPAPTVKSRNSAYNHARTLAAHCRGGALLHPKSLAESQGLSGRAMLAPTIDSQKSDIFLRKPCLLLVGVCTVGPSTVRGKILWFAAAANTGRASPAPTMKSRNSAYNYTHLSRFIVRVGLCSTRRALRQHRALAGEQCSPPTIESQKSDIFFAKTLPFTCRGLHCRPAEGAPSFWHPRSPPIRAKLIPIAKKDPQVYRLQVLFPGAPSRTLPRANQHRTVVLVAACGRPPCSRPWCS